MTAERIISGNTLRKPLHTIIAKINKFASEGKKASVVSTINCNVPFYETLSNAAPQATNLPVVTSSRGEDELPEIDTKPPVGIPAS